MKRCVLLWIFAVACGAQTTDALAFQVKHRIEALRIEYLELISATPRELALAELCKVDCSTPEIQKEQNQIQLRRVGSMDRVTSQIQVELDRFVIANVAPQKLRVDRTNVANGLKQIVSAAGDMQPVTFEGADHTLIVAYSIQKGQLMGPDGTAVTIRSYRPKGTRMELVDSTGTDMNGYGRVSVQQLRSPAKDGMWFLASGYMTGANGPNARLRVYVCRAGKFTTEWIPANVWGVFKTRLTEQGFTVSWNYYRDDRKSRETYQLANDGLYRRP